MSPAIVTTPFDQLTFKASHNSFEYGRLAASLADQLNEHGCRGLELDLVQDSNRFRWCVRHGGTYVSTVSAQLERHLEFVQQWSQGAGAHDPAILYLDLKNAPLSHDSFAEKLDHVIGSVLNPSRLYRPRDLLARSKTNTLVDAVEAAGWPTLEALHGKVLVCLTGHETRKAHYANTHIEDRLCFSDRGSRKAGKRITGNRVFVNHHIVSVTEKPRWPDALRELRTQPGIVLRAYYCNTKAYWDRAITEGVNVLATDEIRIRTVGQTGYILRTKKNSGME